MTSKSILIVDDDQLFRKVLRSFIESRTHFEVCGEAVNGLDAIEKARTLGPDLIAVSGRLALISRAASNSV